MAAKPVYIDGSFSEAFATSLPVFECPFADQGVNTRLVLRQNFVQDLDDFAPLAIGTVHPDYADFFLVQETPHQDLGEGVVTWTRIYAAVPDAFTRPAGNYTYNFIGFYGVFGVNVLTVTGRDRFSRNVPMVLVREFFQTDDPDTDITVIPGQRYYYDTAPNLDVDYLADAPPFTQPTVPSRTDYEALIAADAADPSSYSLVPEASRTSVWMGNIYLRETFKIKAA